MECKSGLSERMEVGMSKGTGAYRPEAFTDSNKGAMLQCGVSIGKKKGYLPFLNRFECNLVPARAKPVVPADADKPHR